MAANLFPQPINGIGAEANFIDSHLLDENGRVRDLADVAREIGAGSAQLTYLDYRLRERLRTPTTRGYPPKIFISYRQETPEHVNWCVQLARALEAAGYEVLLDALALTRADPSPEDIGEFIGQLDADVVLVVLTKSYVGDDHSMRQWLYEEWTRIVALRSMGLLEIIGVAREQGVDESSFVVPHNILDLVIDVSEISGDAGRRKVLDFFGAYRGPRLTGDQAGLLAREAHDSIDASERRDEPAAAAYLARIEIFRDTEEFRLAEASYAAAFRPPEEAVQLVNAARKLNPTLSGSIVLARSLWLLDLDAQAFPIVAEVAETPSLWRGEAHYYMADILARLGFPRTARNHLTWCLTDKPRDIWEKAGSIPEEAHDMVRSGIERLDLALARPEREEWPEQFLFLRSTEDRVAALDRQCDTCQARYSSDGAVCILCGSLHPQATDRCEMCAYQVVGWNQLNFCPVCRHGLGHSKQRFMVSPRGPGERFSVLWPQANISMFQWEPEQE
jgi:hypothetical protein